MYKYYALFTVLLFSFAATAQDTLQSVQVKTDTSATKKSYKKVTTTAIIRAKEFLKALKPIPLLT